MNTEFAHAFARRWVSAWNAHDIEAVLAEFADDVAFTSPVAAQVVPESGGVIRGKAALREYWQAGLRRLPDLHFDVEGVYTGIDTLVIHYRNQASVLVNEVLLLRDGKVVAGHAAYLASP